MPETKMQLWYSGFHFIKLRVPFDVKLLNNLRQHANLNMRKTKFD